MIKLENLTKSFNGSSIQAVEKISLKVEAGSVCALIGTSGSGKTTTLKMINRLIEPTSGEIWIDGKESKTVDPVIWRRGIGYVIQKAGLLPHLTVSQNISLLATILKKDKNAVLERTRELMQMVNMSYAEFHDRYPSELSGGQQQRIGIARALMEDPPVLLMDEPFGALDPVTRKALHVEFRNLKNNLHKTVVLVTHDMKEAFELADQIVLMDKGRIVQSGTKDDFVNRPVNEFVANFVRGEDYV